jgi:hypothetical protein
MDWLGAFFSLMALVAQNTFDVLGGVLYIVWYVHLVDAVVSPPFYIKLLTPGSCLLEIGIFLSHGIWLLRTYKLRMEAAAQGKTFDDIAAEHEEQGLPFKFAERKSRREKRAAESQDLEAGPNDSGEATLQSRVAEEEAKQQ